MNPDLKPRPVIVPSEANAGSEMYLHLGENPYPPHPHVLKAIEQAARQSNRYPDSGTVSLRHALAEYIGNGITPDHILVGNGSDDLIDLIVISLSDPGDTILSFEPSFFVYHFSASRHLRKPLKLSRTNGFHLPIFQEVQPQIPKDAAIAFIANPNNPTGMLTPRDHLLEYIERFPGTLVVDECYFEFCRESVVEQVQRHSRLIVLRSLSKSFGLSGLRVGYAVAHPDTIEVLNRHALTFPVNRVAQAAGIAALECLERYQDHIERLQEERDRLRRVLILAGFAVPESVANFVLVMDGGVRKIQELKTLLDHNRVRVSDQSNMMKQAALRIAVGTPDENAQLIRMIEQRFD